VTFGTPNPNAATGWTVIRDADSTDYAPKQWNANPSQRFPYLFLKNSFLYISEVQWTVQNGDPNGAYQIRAYSPDVASPITNWLDATYNAANATLTADDITTTFQFPATTKFYNPLSIVWQVRVNQGAAKDGGTSANPIYVCLTGPITANVNNQPTQVPALYRTVVHLGCSVSGAANRDSAVANTWGLLTTNNSAPSNLCSWDDVFGTWTRKLYYYKPGMSWLDNPQPGTTTKELLNTQDGACYNWCWIMYDALIINGCSNQASMNAVQGVVITLDPAVVGQPAFNTRNAFVINDFLVLINNTWQANKTFGQLPFAYGPYPNRQTFPDMVPVPPNNIYGSFQSQATLKGQNTSPPAQMIFSDHLIVQYTTINGVTTYYDPSYGTVYQGGNNAQAAQSFQANAVLGYANSVANGAAQITVK